jgi:hypothetical protein
VERGEPSDSFGVYRRLRLRTALPFYISIPVLVYTRTDVTCACILFLTTRRSHQAFSNAALRLLPLAGNLLDTHNECIQEISLLAGKTAEKM